MIKAELIYYLDALDKYQSLTLAAENLHMTVPALSIAIKRFEKEYGFQILHKEGNKISLMEKAREIIALAQPAIKSLNEIEQHINGFNLLSWQKPLTVVFLEGVSLTVGPALVPQIYTKFLEKGIQVEFVIVKDSLEAIQFVQQHEHTVGLINYMEKEDLSGVWHFERLVTEPIYIKAHYHSKFFAETCEQIDIKQLVTIPMTLMTEGVVVKAIKARMQKYGAANIQEFAENMNMLDSYIKADLTVSVCPGFARRILDKADPGTFRFIQIHNFPTVSLCSFASKDFDERVYQNIVSFIRLALA